MPLHIVVVGTVIFSRMRRTISAFVDAKSRLRKANMNLGTRNTSGMRWWSYQSLYSFSTSGVVWSLKPVPAILFMQQRTLQHLQATPEAGVCVPDKGWLGPQGVIFVLAWPQQMAQHGSDTSADPQAHVRNPDAELGYSRRR